MLCTSDSLIFLVLQYVLVLLAVKNCLDTWQNIKLDPAKQLELLEMILQSEHWGDSDVVGGMIFVKKQNKTLEYRLV